MRDGQGADTPPERPSGKLRTSISEHSRAALLGIGAARHHSPGRARAPWSCTADPVWARPCPPTCHPKRLARVPEVPALCKLPGDQEGTAPPQGGKKLFQG